MWVWREQLTELIDYMLEETNSIASAYDDMKQETLENYSLEKITDARLKEKLTTRVQRHSITWIEHNMMNWQIDHSSVRERRQLPSDVCERRRKFPADWGFWRKTTSD
jgi:hypothetical protein